MSELNEWNRDRPARHRMGLAIASLVLGIIGIALSLFLIGGVLAVVGLVLGIVHLSRQPGAPKAMAGWGVALSGIALIASIGFGVLYYQFYQQFSELMAEGATDLANWEWVEAPDLEVRTLEGELIELAQLRGNRVVLNFWATWCGPCVREIPHFIQFQDEMAGEDIVIIGISEESASILQKFVEEKGINYAIASSKGELASPYGDVRAIPTTFIIDRNGVIQNVHQGYLALDELRNLALADDFEGEAKSAPEQPQSELEEAVNMRAAVLRWSTDLSGEAVQSVDWTGDGREELLVVERNGTLRVFDHDGTEVETVRLPEAFTHLEVGRHGQEGLRLLGHSNWGKKVVVMDRQGREIWSYPSRGGVNGAHWGDLTGDGTDEMIVGMNGGGGLHAVSAEGEQIWHVGDIGNVWNQAIISSRGDEPAVVFATEAGGSVRVFDAGGNPVRTIRPHDQYFSQLAAARTSDNGAIQVVAQGEITVAFDQSGTIAWSTPAVRDHGAWRTRSFANGDLTGDGDREWVFLDVDQTLAVVSPAGEKLAAISWQGSLKDFWVVENDGGGQLAILTDGQVRVYGLEPVSRASRPR